MRRAPVLLAVLTVLFLAGCSSGQPAPSSSPLPTLVPTLATSPSPSRSTSPAPSPSPSPVKTTLKPHTVKPTPPVAVPLCGAPSNPYHLNLCGRGSLVYNPPADVCSYFDCIANFPNGKGYMVECRDGTYSMSGGRQGACSYHDGEGTAVTQG
jgi:hypothetical protein